MLAYAPINYYGNEHKNTDCAPRLRNMLASMVNAMNLTEQKNIKGNPESIIKNLFEYYRSQSYKIKDRILLISKDDLVKKIDENDIKKLYPYQFELCSRQKINDVIKNKDNNYYYLQTAMRLRFIFDPASGEVV